MAKLGCFAVVLALLALIPASSSGPGDEATRSSKLLVNGVVGLMTERDITVSLTVGIDKTPCMV